MVSNPRKRTANDAWNDPATSRTRRRVEHYSSAELPREDMYSSSRHIPRKPVIRHEPHPDSNVGKDFHWVPYPLGLMPYDSWHKLHNRANVHPPLPFRCPTCGKERQLTPHMRKVFLVAERLTWEEDYMSSRDKEQTEELNWEVNFELGILDPVVEDAEQMAGGKKSWGNMWYPYKNEYELKQALKFIFTSENVSEASWALWIGMQMDLQRLLGPEQSLEVHSGKRRARRPLPPDPGSRSRLKTPPIEAIEQKDLTKSPDRASNQRIRSGIPTPPSSLVSEAEKRSMVPIGKPKVDQLGSSVAHGTVAVKSAETPPYFHKDRCVMSYKTLQDFYSLLDQIERTSLAGALYLEAYAERLRGDMCRNCWLGHNIKADS